jgi:hypothetical protein
VCVCIYIYIYIYLDPNVFLHCVQGTKLLVLRIVIGGGDDGHGQDGSHDGRAFHPALFGVFVDACMCVCVYVCVSNIYILYLFFMYVCVCVCFATDL